MLEKNLAIKKSIRRIAERGHKWSTSVKVNIKPFPSTNTVFKIKPLKINSVSVESDFLNKYTDDIVISLTLFRDEILNILRYRRYLLIELSFFKTNPTDTNILDETPFFKRTYHAIPLIEGDPESMMSHTDASDEQVPMDISFCLLEQKLSNGRHKNVNTIFQNATVKDAIKFLCNSLGYKEIIMDPVENLRVYRNLEIPTSNIMEEAFTGLQKRYGVYSGGIAFFIRDDVCYVYNAYAILKERYKNKNRVNIYSSGPGDFLGGPGYTFEDKVINILANGDKVTLDTNGSIVNNVGTTMGNVDDSNPLNLNEHLVEKSKLRKDLILSNTKSEGNVVSMSQVRYDSNIFSKKENLISQRGNFININWENSRHFIIPPNQPVTYIFSDLKQNVSSYIAQIERIKTSYVTFDHRPKNYSTMNVSSNMVLRILND